MKRKGMKITVKSLIRDQKGQTLILALILLIVGGLIIAPLLAYMNTGILAGGVYERRMAELYAADAGVENAVWRIQNSVVGDEVYYLYCGQGNHTLSYNITGGVNNKSVAVTITWVNNLTYQVESTATGDGSGTKIDAYVAATIKYYPSIMDQLITIQDNVTDVKQLDDELAKLNIKCPAGCTDCELWCKKAYDYYTEYDNIPTGCRGCVAVYNFPSAAWPTVGSLNSTYWEDVKGGTSYNSSIQLNGQNRTLQAGYTDGTLSITSSDNKQTLTLRLDGTLYVTGITQIGNTNQEFILDLNGNTIFVASGSTGNGNEALQIGGKCSMKGPGVLIAVGDINFKPRSVVGGEQSPIFILSVAGTTSVQPSGDLYGAIGGKIDVDISQGSTPSTTYPADGFGNSTFPRVEAGRTYSIASWEVSPL
jgi:hypothetical protein